MNRRINAKEFEPETTFENNIYEIKANNMKIINSLDTNISAITPNKPSSSSKHLNANIMTWILLQLPGKPPKSNKNLSSMHLEGNTQLQIRKIGLLLDQNIINPSLYHTLSIPLNSQY